MSLTKRVYRVTDRFPPDEKFGLVTQLRRAAVSIPSNIAEGQARRKTREFIRFIWYAEGSLAEIDTQLVLGIELGFCNAHDVRGIFEALAELRTILIGLRFKLSKRLHSDPWPLTTIQLPLLKESPCHTQTPTCSGQPRN